MVHVLGFVGNERTINNFSIVKKLRIELSLIIVNVKLNCHQNVGHL